MSQDKDVQARVKGRQEVARKTVWELTVGVFRLRCLAESDQYVVQLRHPILGGWTTVIKDGKDAAAMLTRSLSTKGLQEALQSLPKFVE